MWLLYSDTLGVLTALNYASEHPRVSLSTSTGIGMIPWSLTTCIMSGILIPVRIISEPGAQSNACN